MPTVLIKGKVRDENGAVKDFVRRVAADAKELVVSDFVCGRISKINECPN